MKLSEILYVRPKKEDVLSALSKASDRFLHAESAVEQIRVEQELQDYLEDYYTMSTLADIRYSTNSDDEFYKTERDFYNESSPEIQTAVTQFYGNYLKSPFIAELKKHYPPIFFTNLEMQLKAADESVVPMLVEENGLRMGFGKASRKVRFEFNGEQHSPATIEKYKNNPDRELRKGAYMAWGASLNTVAEDLDAVFDDMVKLRTKIANKMGFESFTELGYIRAGRNCYNKNDVKVFRELVLKYITPLCVKIRDRVKNQLGIEKNMLYDNGVFTNTEPKPIGSVSNIFDNGIKMYSEMSTETGELMKKLIGWDAIDVIARDGKRQGGFCTSLSHYKLPYIFANFNGSLGDLDVLTHEFGHAFAAEKAFEIPFATLRNGSSETSETHSMSMEFLTYPWMNLFFGDKLNEYKLNHLGSAVCFLPYAVIIDYFQEWSYDNPSASPIERNEKWKELDERFCPFLSTEGIPFFGEGRRWQRQPHLFFSPFYYVDYAIARVVSLQLFSLMQKDFSLAFNKYLKFLNLGGTLPFTELIKSAELDSPFEERTFISISEIISKELL